MTKRMTEELLKQQTDGILSDGNKVIFDLMSTWKRFLENDVQKHIDTLDKREMTSKEREAVMSEVKRTVESSKQELLRVSNDLFTGNVDYM